MLKKNNLKIYIDSSSTVPWGRATYLPNMVYFVKNKVILELPTS